jgi:predicted NAD/FAD-binding protein
MGERIAIIGGGVAGLTAGYLLQRRHDVTLLERSDRLGGNAYTVTTARGETVDIAVAAFGKAGYPLFYRLLAELGVKTRRCATSWMSFEDLDTGAGVYVTPSLKGLLAQRFDLLRPRRVATFARLFLGLGRARRMLARGEFDGLTLAEGAARVPELSGDAFVPFICALCLLSSMSAAEVLASPAAFFFDKLAVHHDVVSPKAVWSVRAMADFTRSYVEALAAPLAGRVRLNAAVTSVRRDPDGVELTDAQGGSERFDRVVLACNADQAFGMLADPTPDEERLLKPWRYKEGRVVLHRDRTSFPPPALMQAYTFLYTRRDGVLATSVNGSLEHEPGVAPGCDLVSSQHPNFPIDSGKIELDTVLRTPAFDFDSVATVAALPRLNGVQRSYYCGSYFGHGLHEDAVRSAVDVAAALGVPW